MVDYFSVTLTIGHDRARLQLCGELDTLSAHELSASFNEACAAEPPLLVIDLAKLSYCDSSGIRALLSAAMQCESKGIEMRLVDAQANVRRIFELTNTAALLRSDQE